jgi:hypothetical protein
LADEREDCTQSSGSDGCDEDPRLRMMLKRNLVTRRRLSRE